LKSLVYRKELTALLIFLIILLVFFYDPIFTGRTYFFDDIEHHYYPSKCLLYDMGQSGQFYRWNPYSYSGISLVGDPQVAMLYPVYWLYFLIPPARGIVYDIIIHFFLAGLFTFIMLRGFKLQVWPALAGAIFYAFSGFMVLRMIHLNILAASTFIPLVIHAANYFTNKRTFLSALLLGSVLGVQVLTGMYQLCLVTFMMTGLFFVLNSNIRGFFRKDQLCFTSLFVIAVIFSIMLPAIQMFPAFENVLLGLRSGGLGLEDASAGSLSIKEFLLFFIPDYFGTRYGPVVFSGNINYWETSNYIGIFPVILALTSLFFIPVKDSDKRNLFLFGILGLFALSLMTGKNSPVFIFFYNYMPFFNTVRIPARYVVFLLPALAYFIAFTIQQLSESALDNQDSHNRKILNYSMIVAGLFIFWLTAYLFLYPSVLKKGMIFFLSTGITGWLLVMLTINKKIPGRVFLVISFILLVISSFSFGYGNNSTIGTDHYSRLDNKILSCSKEVPPDRIIYSPNNSMYATINFPQIYRTSNLTGYNVLAYKKYMEYIFYSDYNTVLTEDYIRYFNQICCRLNIENPYKKMILLLNPAHLYEFTEDDSGITVKVTKIKNSYPRAFLVDRHKFLPDVEILKTMDSDEYEPYETVLLSEEDAENINIKEAPETEKYPDKNNRTAGSVTIYRFEPERILLQVSTDKPRWLFISEVYNPGWKARVNGKPVKVFRGNYIFRTIHLEAGNHNVEFYFSPDSFENGAALTFLALMILLITFLKTSSRKDVSPEKTEK
jgi:hypothetical protein